MFLFCSNCGSVLMCDMSQCSAEILLNAVMNPGAAQSCLSLVALHLSGRGTLAWLVVFQL